MLKIFPVAVVAVAAAGALSACAPEGPPRSAARNQGWVEGCDTGYADAGRGAYDQARRRNDERYDSDPEYREGWREGYKECFEEEQRTPFMGSQSGG